MYIYRDVDQASLYKAGRAILPYMIQGIQDYVYRLRSAGLLIVFSSTRDLVAMLGNSEQAPANLAEIYNQLKQGTLWVSSEHSDTSIYGTRGNAVCRLYHDLGHALYGLEFTTDDESTLARKQLVDLVQLGMRDPLLRHVFLADSLGQTVYEHEHGEFPANQSDFVLKSIRAGKYTPWLDGAQGVVWEGFV